MALEVKCRKCGRLLVFDESRRGSRFTCPACGSEQVVEPRRNADQGVEEKGVFGYVSLFVAYFGFLMFFFRLLEAAPHRARYVLFAFIVIAAIPAAVGLAARLSATGKGNTAAVAGVAGIAVLAAAAMLYPRIEAWAMGPHPYRKLCAIDLRRIGRAMKQYSTAYAGYWPYDARGPLRSLSLLYPGWIFDPSIFVCPGVEEEERSFPPGCSLAGSACSYGYDSEAPAGEEAPVAPRLADMPGNHGEDGVNLLMSDGRVIFTGSPLAPNDPTDGIFRRDGGREPDADTFIRQ